MDRASLCQSRLTAAKTTTTLGEPHPENAPILAERFLREQAFSRTLYALPRNPDRRRLRWGENRSPYAFIAPAFNPQ